MRVLLAAFLLTLLLGCGGGEKPAGKNEAGKATAKGEAPKDSSASATAKTDGEKQVVTYQTGDQKMTIESDGKTVVVKSDDGKATKVDVAGAQELAQTAGGEAAGKTASDTAGAAETTEASPPKDKTESEAPKTEAMKIQSSEGTMTFGGTDVPEGFPLPVYKDAKVEYSAHVQPSAADKEEMYQLHLSTKDAADAVAKFYEAALKKKGLEVNRLDQKINSMEIITLTGESSKDKVSASAQAQRDADSDTTRIILVWTRQP